MSTDSSPGSAPDPGNPAEGAADLVFAPHDLRGERPRTAPVFDDAVTFAAAPRPADAAAAAAAAARRASAAPPPAPAAAPSGFQVFSSSPAPATVEADGEKGEKVLPWTVREVAPQQPSRRGWSARQSGSMERSAVDTLRRLREDAVHVSWKSAWIAVNTAEGRAVRNLDL